MSELSAHDPEPIDGPGPDPAGFPAAQPAAPQQLPSDPPPDDERAEGAAGPVPAPRLAGRRRHRRCLVAEPAQPRPPLTPQQRLLILDAWVRSGLPAADFAPLVGVSRHTLYLWKKRFDEHGPAGLTDQPRGAPDGSRLPEVTKRTILLLKQAHPDFGCQKISDLLLRGPALPASPAAVARVLRDAGYALEDVPGPAAHEPPARRFERAGANQLWQTDLFTFMLKRQNRRAYLVAFLDDHSRFVTGFGLHASQSTALVLEVLRAALDGFGSPEEILTDNGSQYVTWRGTSAFTKELGKRGIRQVVASPRHPQTLGKIERFWGSLWRECLEAAVFVDLADARRRVGHYVDHYNFQRPHQGIGGLVPADRYFGAAPEVRRALEARVQGNALELAREGLPRPPFYVAGQVGGRGFSLHAEGERVILTDAGGQRREVELGRPAGEAPASVPEPVGPAVTVAGAAAAPRPDMNPTGTTADRRSGYAVTPDETPDGRAAEWWPWPDDLDSDVSFAPPRGAMIEVGGASPPSLAARDVEGAVFADFCADDLRRWPVETLHDGGAPPLWANPDAAPGGESFAEEADEPAAAWLPAVLGLGAVWLTAAPEEKKGRMVMAR